MTTIFYPTLEQAQDAVSERMSSTDYGHLKRSQRLMLQSGARIEVWVSEISASCVWVIEFLQNSDKGWYTITT